MPSADESAVLEARDVVHRYGSGRTATTALGPVDLTIDRGEFVVVVGASGCGKSTLLRLIAGFEQPSEGTLLVHGRTARPGRSGLVFQQPRLLPWRTVGGNIDLALAAGGVPADERVTRRDALLDQVGLPDVAHRRTWELSGGQQQRVAIARALAVPSDLLLLDEPFAALDVAVPLPREGADPATVRADPQFAALRSLVGGELRAAAA
ncbi:MAG: ATP-binding cassette domain-containing protein [Tetrasphaera sp.]|nr:ATP-binding cassette domain-containing protein [Tetrasphaera sp.]